MQSNLRLGKVAAAIRGLPDSPDKPIYWIVYNADMIKYTENLIREIKGQDYLGNVTVVAKGENSKNRERGYIYFDPGLYDYLGNGNA